MFTTKRVRGLAVAAIAVIGLPILAACSSGSGGGSTSGGDKVNIAYLTYIVTDYQNAAKRGMTSVIKGGGGKVTVFSANFDPQTQLSQCNDAITSGRYNAIVISPIDPASAAPCVKAADAAGIPVVTYETSVGTDPYSLKPQVPGVIAAISTPLKTSTDGLGELMIAACGDADPCRVVGEVASGADVFSNQIMDALAKKYGSKVDIVQRIATGYDPAQVTTALPDVLSAHPDVNVFVALTDSTALAAVPTLKTAGLEKKVKLVGIGGSTEAVDAIKDGTLFGSLSNWPFQYGAAAAKALTQSVKGEKVDPVGINMLTIDKPLLITPTTVDEFTPEWGATFTK
ncbi:MAG TPA: sugar ABC transporter substrate-binding protein [Pseudolysinimonas sp.]|nr:sugar ABC transporter substrate-binding protein [Pseudolysinimonas sp.]